MSGPDNLVFRPLVTLLLVLLLMPAGPGHVPANRQCLSYQPGPVDLFPALAQETSSEASWLDASGPHPPFPWSEPALVPGTFLPNPPEGLNNPGRCNRHLLVPHLGTRSLTIRAPPCFMA